MKNYIYKLWCKFPKVLRVPISSFSGLVLPLIYFKGKKVSFRDTSFQVEINHLGDLLRSKEFSYKEGRFTEGVYDSVKESKVVYDIGAHVGYYVLLASKINTEASVVAFEPEPRNYEVLKRNLDLNHVGNVITKNIAVGEVDSELKFDTEKSIARSGGGSHRITRSGKGQSVKVRCLDSLIDDDSLPVPDMVLIDIEGSELSALRGMKKTLELYKPKLFIEVHKDLLEKRSESVEALDSMLLSLGYQKNVLRKPEGVQGEHKQTHVCYVS